MKAILTFNLDDPDDRMAHLRCVKAINLALALFDIEGYLRGKEKYDGCEISGETREQLYEIMNKYDITLDNLMQ